MAMGGAMPVPGGRGMTPIGRVTITTDAAGGASAELVSPAGPTLSPSISAADGVAKLKADFGVDLVAGDKTWSDSDTGDVVQALGSLKPSDRAALKGVQIIRVSTLPKGHSGEFNAGGGVASGATTVQSLPTLKLADSAFPKHRFALGPTGGTPLPVPPSEQTVLHEVGHAVEEAIARAALEEADTA